jgi:hypothetical protein
MNTIDLVLSKSNFLKAVSINVDFQNIEHIIGFPLPDDYKYYLTSYKKFEGFIGNEYLRLWESETRLQLNKDYNIDSLVNVIAIGTNGNAEFIGIELKNNSYGIILSPFIHLDKNNFIPIGKSFTDMLIKLDSGDAWYK